MSPRPDPADFSKIRTYSLESRKSLVSLGGFGKPFAPGGSFCDFLDSLPDFLGARDLKALALAVADARKNDKNVILAMGAHPIKVGLSPVIRDLMEGGVLTALAVNGAALVHDLEIALAGKTSEDVAVTLPDGNFGMARETGEMAAAAMARSRKNDMGLGEAAGRLILDEKFPHAEESLLATAARLDIPMTVHVAVGTDIIHTHPTVDPLDLGFATHLDFRAFTSVVAGLAGGVYLNLGSAVLMPEVFLKALSAARNLGADVTGFTSAVLDMNLQYRAMENVVRRPTAGHGKGYYLRGQHEVLFPLLAAAVKEALAVKP